MDNTEAKLADKLNAVQTGVDMYKYNEELLRGDSEFKYYFLGLLAADGYVSSKSNRLEIALKEDDVALLRVLSTTIAPGKPLRYRQKLKAYTLTVESKAIHEVVELYMCTGQKSINLIFPYGIPDQYINHFIRGYSDGDGNVGVKRGQRKLKTGEMKYYYGLRYRILGTRPFLQGLHMNLRRLCGLKHNARPHRKGTENVYYIEYGFSAAEKVLDFLYKDATYYLYRKRRVYEHIKNSDSSDLGRVYGTPEGCYNT